MLESRKKSVTTVVIGKKMGTIMIKRILKFIGFGPSKPKAKKGKDSATEELFSAVESACRLRTINEDNKEELVVLCDRVRAAITNGADVNAVRPFGSLYSEDKELRMSVLSLAAVFGLEEMMAILLNVPNIDLGRGVVRMCKRSGFMLSGVVYNPSIEESVEVHVAGPLSLACMQGHSEIVRMLLSHKGMKQALKTNNCKFTPWTHYEPEWESAVCAAGCKLILRMLLDFVADNKEMRERGYKALLKMWLSPLEKITHFQKYPAGKDFVRRERHQFQMELMLERIEECKPILQDSIIPLLQSIAQRGDSATLAQLIEKMAVKGEHAQVVLVAAFESSNAECIKLLLSIPGVDVMPSLIVSAAKKTEKLPLLLCLAHPTARKPLPVAAIIASVEKERADNLQLLLAHPEKVDGSCIDALILAAQRKGKMMEILLQAFNWSVPEVLAAFKASILSDSLNNSQLLLEWCHKKKDIKEIFLHLEDNERKLFEEVLVKFADSKGSEMLDLLLTEYDWSSDTLVSALLAAVKVYNRRNMNKLLTWCVQKNIEVPQRVLDEMWILSLKKKQHHLLHFMLTDLDININKVIDFPHGRNSALSYAVGEGNTELVKTLLAVKGINVNNKDNHHGMTPLILAVSCGFREIAQLLLDAPGVDLNETDADGRTALDLARMYNDKKLIEMLQKVKQ